MGSYSPWIETRDTHLVTDEGLSRLLCALSLGDIILSIAASDGLSRRIVAFQERNGYPLPAATATHAAIYVGQGYVVHAIAKDGTAPSYRAVRQPLISYFSNRQIVLLTAFSGAQTPPSIELELRQKIVSAAESQVGKPYGVKTVLHALRANKARSKGDGAREARQLEKMHKAQDRALTCGELVITAYMLAFGQACPIDTRHVRMPARFVLPSHFYVHPALRDVPVG